MKMYHSLKQAHFQKSYRWLKESHVWKTEQSAGKIAGTGGALFRKFRLEFKRKGPFRFLPTGIFGITSGGGPLISVGIFRSKFAVPFFDKPVLCPN